MSLTKFYERVTGRLGMFAREAYPVHQSELFPQDVVVHFSYHKCLTYYYMRVMKRLRKEFGFYYHSCASNSETFNSEVLTRSGKRVLTLSDRDDVAWEQFPRYKGSHFIRDPRDLIVSGYHYHLWTKEAWCRAPNFGWAHFIAMPEFQYVESDPAKHPRTESYQEYLNTLNTESGMIMEMLWRKGHFEQMRRWNYQNPLILEMRYEEIVGNEGAAFEQLFAHYGFHTRLRERGLELVEQFSLKNQPHGERDHLRSGEARQWEEEFTPLLKQVFERYYGELLIHLNYERDSNW